MDDSVSAELKDRIAAKVESGRYASPDAVMQAAMDRLDGHEREQDRKRAALRSEIQKGLDSGPSVQADDAYWESVKARGRDRVENSRKATREAGR